LILHRRHLSQRRFLIVLEPFLMLRPLNVVRSAGFAATAVFGFAVLMPAAAMAGALDTLDGSWAGGGNVTFDGGAKEKLRCNGYYKSGGEDLSMAIKCASAGGAKIELRGTMKNNGGKVSGDWEERTYNAGGAIAGSASDGSLKIGITGTISGTMSVSFSKSSQTVAIATTGSTLRNVNISFNRN
jgi:hypothetical protein